VLFATIAVAGGSFRRAPNHALGYDRRWGFQPNSEPLLVAFAQWSEGPLLFHFAVIVLHKHADSCSPVICGVQAIICDEGARLSRGWI
jgi:hypothetical protein